MSSLNHILPISIGCVILCLIFHKWVNFTTLLVYTTIMWFLMVVVSSTWLGFIFLKSTLKAKAPFTYEPLIDWLRDRMKCDKIKKRRKRIIDVLDNDVEIDKNSPERSVMRQLLTNIDDEFIGSWYYTITDDKTFCVQSKIILQNLFKIMSRAVLAIDDIRLSRRIADIFLLHLKEYRRSLRRVEKKKATKLEDAYKYLHPGSRNSEALEHNMHRLVALIASEFLQWEVTSSLPCKLLISVLSKQLLTTFSEISKPNWIFPRLLRLLKCRRLPEDSLEIDPEVQSHGIISASRPLNGNTSVEINQANEVKLVERPSGFAEKLWTVLSGSTTNIDGNSVDDPDDEQSSPVYEEPVDFATTISRLRNLLQQKSTPKSPTQANGKTHAINDGSQFRNIAIPWTEYHTSCDGSQQLLYCIQFDDIEQHGEDIFETITATVRRQYSDFVQLHTSLEKISAYSSIISEIDLPDGGRTEMEVYLRTLCLRLGDSPVLIRHFLRPTSAAGKKAEAVAPRFDRILAKTVTGVFNTLKTVVPGFEIEEEDFISSTLMSLADTPWRFIEDMKSVSLSDELEQVVTERIDYCSVDTAYEAVDTADGYGDSESQLHWWKTAWNCPCDEELEEFDGKLGMTCVSVDLLCEVLAGIGSSNVFRQEAIVRWFKLFFGNLSEEIIHQRLLGLFTSIQSSFEELDVSEETADSHEKVVEEIFGKISKDLKMVIGENDLLLMINFLIDSCKNRRINLDLALQFLDAGIYELLAASKARDNSTS